MRHLITLYLPWLLSLVTIVMTVMAGNKNRYAWAVALVGQVLWLVWIVASRSWGLLPMNLVLWAVYVRNHLQWTRKPYACPRHADFFGKPHPGCKYCEDPALGATMRHEAAHLSKERPRYPMGQYMEEADEPQRPGPRVYSSITPEPKASKFL